MSSAPDQTPPLSRRAPRGRRRGGVLVLVAGGMVALLALAGMSLDVSWWYMQQTRLEYATRAAAAAGFERLKDLDFNYRNPATRRSVDQTIREYLELNGCTVEQAAAARIQVSKLNEITVMVNQVSGTYLASLGGVDAVEIAGAGRIQHTNDIAPFAMPPRYPDPDHDLVANLDPRTGVIGDVVDYELQKPYVVKYGKPIFSQFDDFVFIPMDSVPFRVPPAAFHDIKVPTPTPGRFIRHMEPVVIPAQHVDPAAAYSVGVFRAYGVAYAVLGLGEVDGESATLNWMLGLAGGSFLIKRKFMEAAGYRLQDRGDGTGVLIDERGASTNTVAMLLRLSDRSHRHYSRDFALFRYLAEELPDMEPAPVKVLVLSEQPQVLTVTGSADPVTRVMDFARIPYVAVSDQWNPQLHKDPNSSCVVSYRIQEEFPSAFESPEMFRSFLEGAPNAMAYLKRMGRLRLGDEHEGPLRERGFDWVHIHHEDFTEAGLFPEEKRSMVLGLRDFVRRGHHHLFAACLAIESLEIFLSAADFGENPIGLFPEMLDYTSCLAFEDFELDESRGGWEKLGPYASSSIDSESSQLRDRQGRWTGDREQGEHARWFMTDYMNPRCQNHDGLGGVRLDLSRYPPVVTPPVSDPARRMIAPEGATNSMRIDVIKPHRIGNHDGQEIDSLNQPCMVLGAVGDPTRGVGNWQGEHVRYLTGVADDDNDLENGHGQFTYLGGHRPADPGGFTRVGNLIEGVYYDDNDVWVPEVLHTQDGRELRIDLDGDGAARSLVEIVQLGKDGNSPLSLSPPPGDWGGWPTHASAPAQGTTTGEAPADAVDPTTLERIHWNDPEARWVARQGQDNYVALHESSAVVIHDLDNDGLTGGVFPGDLYEVGKPNVPGYRTYLNNILYGSVAIAGEKRYKLNLGAVNPGALPLGEGPGSFGFLEAQGTGESLREIFQYGCSIPGGLPLGKTFSTAPGIFTEQIGKAMEFNFRDSSGQIDSIPWDLSDMGRKAGPTQVKVVPVVERIDDPGKSHYHGYDPLHVRVVGFARMFLIDPSIDELTLTEDREDPYYMGGPPLEGEVRGIFLGWVIRPDGVPAPR